MAEIRRGDVFWIIGGNPNFIQKTDHSTNRPAVIVSNDMNNAYALTVEVVFVTTQMDGKWLPTHVPVALDRPSKILCEQIHSVPKEKLQNYIGHIDGMTMEAVEKALRVSLGM